MDKVSPMTCETQSQTRSENVTPEKTTLLWVDKYAPKHSDDIIGNNGAIQSFTEWLKDWDNVVIKGFKK